MDFFHEFPAENYFTFDQHGLLKFIHSEKMDSFWKKKFCNIASVLWNLIQNEGLKQKSDFKMKH